jgi:hypothetical protein
MSRIVESVGNRKEIKRNYVTRNYVPLVLTVVVALALIVAIVGYVLSGGILPNAYKGLSLITYPTENQLSSQTFESPSISVVRMPSFDFGTLKGKVLGPTDLPAIGASVIAEKAA